MKMNQYAQSSQQPKRPSFGGVAGISFANSLIIRHLPPSHRNLSQLTYNQIVTSVFCLNCDYRDFLTTKFHKKIIKQNQNNQINHSSDKQ
jgi:hypothetical protein